MGTRGKLEVDIDLKSDADKYWQTLRDSTEIFPKAFPHDYKSIEILVGDGKAAGSVRHITYAEGLNILLQFSFMEIKSIIY